MTFSGIGGSCAASSVWRRIERESAADYWEENVVVGRRQVRALLRRRLEPLQAERVLDLGCGAGVSAAYLGRHGAEVTAIDRHPRFARWRRISAVRFVAADLHQPCLGRQRFTTVLVQEVLEDFSRSDRTALLQSVAALAVPRLFLVLRTESGWHRWLRVAAISELPIVDPVQVIRSVHLSTSYRLLRQEEVSCRNYRATVVEFRYGHDEAEV